MTDLEEALLGKADDDRLMVGLRDLAQQAALQSVADAGVRGLSSDDRTFIDGAAFGAMSLVEEVERIRAVVNAPPEAT